MRIAIVTDSTADLPSVMTEKLDIAVIPTIIVMDGQDFEDGRGISRQVFYQKLPEMDPSPTTAAPAGGVFANTYQRLLDAGYDQVLSIHAARQLSGIYNSARVGGQDFPGQVVIEDSGQTSMGLGFQAIRAAEVAGQGGTMDEIRLAVQEVRERVVVLAMLDSMEYLRRSGRVSWVQANLGSLLRLKLFIKLKEGQVSRLGQARTRRKGIAQLQGMIQDLGPLEDLALMHTNAEADARDLQTLFAPQVPSPIPVIHVTTVIGTHVGPNGLGCAAVLAAGSEPLVK